MGTRAYHGKSRMRFNIDGLLAADERARRAEAAKVREIVEQLKRLMTPDAYDAWWNTAPDNNAEFLAAATAKLAGELAAWDKQERMAEDVAKRRVEFVDHITAYNAIVARAETISAELNDPLIDRETAYSLIDELVEIEKYLGEN